MDKALSDYVRLLSWIPVCIIMFSDQQLQTLKDLKRETGYVVAYIDATSGVVRNVPGQKKQKLFVYALCVRSPLNKKHPMALCEFILEDQRGPAINYALRFFHDRYVTYLYTICFHKFNLRVTHMTILFRATEFIKPERGVPIIDRYQCDDSHALMNAIIGAEWTNMEMPEYLNMCFKELFLNQQPSKSNLLVCRSHLMNTLQRTVKKSEHGIHLSYVRHFFKLFQFLAESKTFREVVYYVQKLFVMLTSKYITANVAAAFRTSNQPMPASFELGKFLICFTKVRNVVRKFRRKRFALQIIIGLRT